MAPPITRERIIPFSFLFFLVFTLLFTLSFSFLSKSQPQGLHIFVCSRRSRRRHVPCRMKTQHSFLLLPILLEQHHEQDLVPSVQRYILAPQEILKLDGARAPGRVEAVAVLAVPELEAGS